jgi:hypothetical protein
VISKLYQINFTILQKFLLTFLEVKSSMIVLISILSNIFSQYVGGQMIQLFFRNCRHQIVLQLSQHRKTPLVLARGDWQEARSIHTRDGNRDPIPDFPRGIPLLGDTDGGNLVPIGIETGRILKVA